MKAAICICYGPPDVVELRDVAKPKPKPNEVLVRVHASCVNSGDARIRALNVPKGMGLMVRLMFGWRGPRQPILGTDFAGVVEAIGSSVNQFSVGDEVFGSLGTSTGTHAEYVAISENGTILLKPNSLSMKEAASLVFGGLTGLSFLKGKASLKLGEHVLINGATGAVGVASIQIAKSLGSEVTAVCSQRNVDLARSLGADYIIDYTNEDFTNSGKTYDVIMDNVGNAPWKRSKRVLKPNGRLVLIVSDLIGMIGGFFRSKRNGRYIIGGVAADNKELLSQLSDLTKYEHIKPTIDQEFPLDQIGRAYEYVDKGRKRGSVVLDLTAK